MTDHVTVEDDVINVVTVYDDQQVVLENMAIQTVSVGEQGPQGPAGPEGVLVAQSIIKEAGENLVAGVPVYVNANKFYLADNVTNHAVVGVVTIGALTGFLSTAVVSGSATLSGLSDGNTYFLGNKVISTAVPSSGNVVRVGRAISGTTLLVSIEEPILLS